MQTMFHHFTNNTWLYQNEFSDRVVAKMSIEERREFVIDVQTIKWDRALANQIFGLRRYHFKEDIYHPSEQE